MGKKTFLAIALLCLATTALAQKSKHPKPAPQGTPVLWREPADIESRDLFNGPGGESMKPDLSRVTFVKDQAGGGYSINYRVRDGAGKTWVAKLRDEAQPETAAVRLVWALGYVTEINYLVPCVKIEGAPDRKVKRCEGGGFANVKFEARPKEVKRLKEWQWASNPFSGTKELQGLIVLMSLMNNWDLKDANNRILFVPNGAGGDPELQYILSDLGATFGKTGGFISRSRNRPEDFAKSKFIEGVEGNRVKFAYGGKNTSLLANITVEQARWIGSLLSRLSDKQISDAFRAANYSPDEVQLLTDAFLARIKQLEDLPQ
ncbi:MAG: hypothetical protein QOH42_914 [Blastocatellia bacterium]|nr:hypothetical protein [Blastocatellia bacterium]